MQKIKMSFASDEFLNLIEDWQKNENARSLNTIVAVTEGLVRRVAGKIARRNPHLDVDDLFQEGRMKIMEAASKFDKDKGAAFQTYAAILIEQGVRAYVIEHGGAIRMPTSGGVRDVFNKYNKTLKALAAEEPELKGDALDVEIAKRLNVTLEMLKSSRAAMQRSFSLNAAKAFADGVDEREHIDFLAEDPDQNTTTLVMDKMAEDAEKETVVRAVLNLRDRGQLSDRNYDIFVRRKVREHTLESISQDMGVSRERVRQVADAAFAKIKKECLLIKKGRSPSSLPSSLASLPSNQGGIRREGPQKFSAAARRTAKPDTKRPAQDINDNVAMKPTDAAVLAA